MGAWENPEKVNCDNVDCTTSMFRSMADSYLYTIGSRTSMPEVTKMSVSATRQQVYLYEGIGGKGGKRRKMRKRKRGKRRKYENTP